MPDSIPFPSLSIDSTRIQTRSAKMFRSKGLETLQQWEKEVRQVQQSMQIDQKQMVFTQMMPEEFKKLLASRETVRLDFKETYLSEQGKLGNKQKKELVKDIACFANTNGGKILIGVREDPREVVGIDTQILNEERIQQLIRAHSVPPIPNVGYEIFPHNQGDLIIISVLESHLKPHEVDETTWIRSGSICDQASAPEIIEMGKRAEILQGQMIILPIDKTHNRFAELLTQFGIPEKPQVLIALGPIEYKENVVETTKRNSTALKLLFEHFGVRSVTPRSKRFDTVCNKDVGLEVYRDGFFRVRKHLSLTNGDLYVENIISLIAEVSINISRFLQFNDIHLDYKTQIRLSAFANLPLYLWKHVEPRFPYSFDERDLPADYVFEFNPSQNLSHFAHGLSGVYIAIRQDIGFGESVQERVEARVKRILRDIESLTVPFSFDGEFIPKVDLSDL